MSESDEKKRLEEAIKLLKRTVKSSTALDEFKHIDLSLVASDQRQQYVQALMLVKKSISENLITKEQFELAVGIK